MHHFLAFMHLVAAALHDKNVADSFGCPIDQAFALRDYEHDEFRCVEAYAVMLGMPADEAFVLALCRGDRRRAFDEHGEPVRAGMQHHVVVPKAMRDLYTRT